MMEVKFRGYSSQSKCWHYGYLYQTDSLSWITDSVNMNLSKNRDLAWWNVNPNSVGIFTGLKDKNDIEIYEGDILKTETDKPMVVGWSKKFASFILDRNGWAFSHWFGESCNPENCEVIGNIYENHELLK